MLVVERIHQRSGRETLRNSKWTAASKSPERTSAASAAGIFWRRPQWPGRAQRRAAGLGRAIGSAPTSQKEKTHEETQTRGIGSLGAGRWLHEHQRQLRPARRQGSRASPRFARAFEKGVTFFDTAEVYGPYTNEELVGEALAPFRDKVAIATKFGFDIEARSRLQQPPEHIKKVVEASLKRLRTDRIDLYLPAPRRPARADRGCGRHGQGPHQGGQSSALRSVRGGRATIRRAHAVQPVAAVQSEYSLWTSAPERNGVLEVCEELGIGFVPWARSARAF